VNKRDFPYKATKGDAGQLLRRLGYYVNANGEIISDMNPGCNFFETVVKTAASVEKKIINNGTEMLQERKLLEFPCLFTSRKDTNFTAVAIRLIRS